MASLLLGCALRAADTRGPASDLADAQGISDPRVAELVRAGRIRVAVFPPEYTKDPVTGELRGWAIDLARALAARLGIEMLPDEYPTPPKVLEGLKARTCDVAFLATDPSWVTEVEFSPPLMQVDFTYLVSTGSSIRRVADADRREVHIAVVRNHASTLALNRVLKHATLIQAESPDAAFDLLRTGRADVLASVRPALLGYSAQLPGSEVLPDRYGFQFLAMAIPKGQEGWLAYINEFIKEAKASGLLQRAIDRAGWRHGVQVPPGGTSQ